MQTVSNALQTRPADLLGRVIGLFQRLNAGLDALQPAAALLARAYVAEAFFKSMTSEDTVNSILQGIIDAKGTKRDGAEKDDKKSNFTDELSKSMNTPMKYVMPVIMFFIAKSFPLVVSLYLITSSLFAIGQALYIRNKYKKNIVQVVKK